MSFLSTAAQDLLAISMIFHFDRFHGSASSALLVHVVRISIENLGNSASLENWWNVSQSTFLHEIVTDDDCGCCCIVIIIFIVFDISKLTTRAERNPQRAKSD